jgi:hypothetical protein
MISEQERVYIKNLYGLLTEDVKTDPNQVTLEFEEKFPGSKYANLTENGKTELIAKLNEARDWLVTNKGSLIFVQVEAGESKLKNFDKEQDPPVEVPEGYLSKKRAKTLKRELTAYFKTLVDQKVLPEMPIFEPPKITYGKSPVSATLQALPNIPTSQYADEQFTKVFLKLMMPEKCLSEVDIVVQYVKEKNGSFKCRGGHTCDEANFDVLLNGISIGKANLNNGSGQDKGGSRSSGRLLVTPEIAKKVITKDKRNIILSLKCLSGANCHSGTPEVQIRKNNELIWHRCSPAMDRGDQNETKILEIDPCGNVTEMGTGDATNKDVAADANKTDAPVQAGYTINVADEFEKDTRTFVYRVGSKMVDSSGIDSYNSKTVNEKFNKGYVKDKQGNEIGWVSNKNTGDFFIGSEGTKFVSQDGTPFLLNVEPGTKISKIVPKGAQNDNPPAGYTSKSLDKVGQGTGAGNYHVEEGTKTYDRGKELKLVKGPPQSVLDKQKADLEAEKAAGITRFNLDDDAIDVFEDFFMTKNKLVTKSTDGIYTVTANSINYGGKPYKKGSKLKLES